MDTDAELDPLSGFTLEADIIGISAILATITHAKLYKGPAFDGTKNPSAYTTRVAVQYGNPDANGVFDITAPFSFPGIATIENTWGVGFFTSATAGSCRMVRRFADMKFVFVGDTLTVVSAPVFSEAVDL